MGTVKAVRAEGVGSGLRRGGRGWVLAGLVGLAGSGQAQAESLRCNGHSVADGDSRLALLHRCGQPLLTDQFCAPVWHVPSQRWLPTGPAGGLLPCQVVEEWLYDRGPGQLMATVRLRDGRIQSIVYGQVPR